MKDTRNDTSGVDHAVACVGDTSSQQQYYPNVPIAICGYSHRLPGGIDDDDDFWQLLSSRGYIQEEIDGRYGKGATMWDGFSLDNPAAPASPYEALIRDGKELEFDCSLFGMSKIDAIRMDPQMKMMLMTTWNAIQHAGYDQARLQNSDTGVFMGIQTGAIGTWRPLYGATPSDIPGKSGSMIANRISFHFNWMGPSFVMATACSSGITALDAAIKSLQCRECTIATFGAIQYLGTLSSSVGFNALGIISESGLSRSFDKDANGYIRSEGAFVYILKRLDDAQRDGDNIFGVIRGCALNCAGAEMDAEVYTPGRMIVAPVGHAQETLMRQVLAKANVDPLTVQYIEAHATGTVVGDSIEGNAIANVYGRPTLISDDDQEENKVEEDEYLYLSSVRSNVGHMESASFTCSLLKVLLMLQRRKFLPISGSHQTPTDKVPFASNRMKVLTEVKPFPDKSLVRIGINSFGFGGANGHCIVEEYVPPSASSIIDIEDHAMDVPILKKTNEVWSKLPGLPSLDMPKTYVVPLSAKSDEALIENARRLYHRLDAASNRPNEIDKNVILNEVSENIQVVDEEKKDDGGDTASPTPQTQSALEQDKVSLHSDKRQRRHDEDALLNDLHTVVGNLSVRMTHHRIRTAFTASTIDELKQRLKTFVDLAETNQLKGDEIVRTQLPPINEIIGVVHADTIKDIKNTKKRRILMVFPGQGAQWAGCGVELYRSEIIFRRVVDTIDTEWIKLAGCKLSDVAFQQEKSSQGEDPANDINNCCWAQPITFMIQVGLYELLRYHGVHPQAVLGHSAGEAAAAYASGAYTLEEACFLVYHRSRIQDKLAGCGRMLVLMSDSASTQDLINRYVDAMTNDTNATEEPVIEIACYNSPSQTVVCGSESEVLRFQEHLKGDGLPSGTLIAGNIAFHSHHMNPIKDELFEVLSALDKSDIRRGPIPMISTVTGTPLEAIDTNYWWSNVRMPVDLVTAIKTAQDNIAPDVLIELSPHITLRSPLRDFYSNIGEDMPSYIHTLIRKANTADVFGQAIGRCFQVGIPVDFQTLYPRPRPITHLLPSYAMKLERTIDNNLDEDILLKLHRTSVGPLVGHKVNKSDHFLYETVVSKRHYKWMADHVVQGQPIIPAAGYLELVLEALKGKSIKISRLRILSPFVLSNDAAMMFTELEPCQNAANKYEVKIYSRRLEIATDCKYHCKGFVEVIPDDDISKHIPKDVPWTLRTFEDAVIMYEDKEDFYATMTARIGHSFSYGPYFQVINRVEFIREINQMKLDIKIDPVLWQNWNKMGYVFHPSMLDGALQAFLVNVLESADFSGVPQMVNSFTVIRGPSSEHVVVMYEGPEYLKGGMSFHKGQLAMFLGEANAGKCSLYDGATGELLAYLAEYNTHGANDRTSEQRYVNHFLSWQPKESVNMDSVVTNMVTELSTANAEGFPSAIRAAIGDIISSCHPNKNQVFFANVAECISGALPEKLVMESCLPSLCDSPVQYTVIASDLQYLTDTYQKFGLSNANANLRFAMNVEDTSCGLLRPSMFELLLLRHHEPAPEATEENETDDDGQEATEETETKNGGQSDTALEPSQDIANALKLVSPGCLVVVETTDLNVLSYFGGLECLFKTSITSISGKFYCIFRAPPLRASEVNDSPLDSEGIKTVEQDVNNAKQGHTDGNPTGKSSIGEEKSNVCETCSTDEISETASFSAPSSTVVIKDNIGFADFWKSENSKENFINMENTDFDNCITWTRVDYFAMYNEELDTELCSAPNKLTEFVKEMGLRRNGNKDTVQCVFTIFTSGAVMSVSSPSQTGVWGAARSLAQEVGDPCLIELRFVDVATKEDLCLAPYCEPMRERELCIRNGQVWCCRLINNRDPVPMAQVASHTADSFRLETNNSGILADLKFRLQELPPLGPSEIELEVKAAALNFRDIMVALGRLPLQSYEASMLGHTVGMECCGVVVRCGSEANDYKVGDRVLAMQGGCIANRIHCHEKAAYPLPENLSFEEGSAISSVYVTAYYALVYLARLREGQTVLIHSALGGVGQAAISLAKLYKAKIYATAGSEEKRQALRDMGCIDAFDSHSTKWYDDLMKSSNGRGVQVVLNSLAGEHLDLCLEALSPGGIHCEIGKVDIYADRPMKMSVFRKNIAFRAIDVDRLMTDDPYLTRELVDACMGLIAEGKVAPLPCHSFPFAKSHDALTYMMKGQHRGKIVLVPPGPGETMEVVDDRKLFSYGKDGKPKTVLLTGCLGGFGLRLLAYIVSMGARHIVMMDRDPQRKRSSDWVLDASHLSLVGKDRLKAELRLEILYGDTGVYEHVVDVISKIESMGMPPLGSVFHLAGVLDDRKVEEINMESFSRVYKPKADGAWNLHRATLACKSLEKFVMVSSTSSVFGNIGQTNYSAANSYLDGLAELRHQLGLPAVSFCMGAVIEVGMASKNNQLLQMMKMGGMPPMSCIFAIDALDSAIRNQNRAVAVAALTRDLQPNFDSSDYLRTLAQLVRNNDAFKLGSNATMSKEALVELLSDRIGKLCGVEKLDPSEPFSTYGLNSISVAELVSFLKNEMSYTVSAMELMTSATCESLANGIILASQAKPEEAKEVMADDDTTEKDETAEEGNEAIWSQPIVYQQSRFAPTLEDHFEDFNAYVTATSGAVITRTASQKTSELKVKANGIAIAGKRKVLSEDNSLPFPCQEALEALNSFVDSFNVNTLKQAVAVKDIKSVLLTGATGFVGRHFIWELLKYKDANIQAIYCPVRADSDASAKERLVEMMQDVGVWEEGFESKLHIFKGDLDDEQLGLSPNSYNELTENVDAVFHFAANLNLAASFKEISEDNNKTMRAVFRFCLTSRRKHLFLASTLGIFPQYFCQFTNELSDKAIERNAMPEIPLLKKMFPLSIGGYAWSKLINETAALRAQKKTNIPLAVFRLPLMFTNGKTGHFVRDNPHVRAFFASLQVRMIPDQRPIIIDDSAVSNEMMLRISFNPSRKNTIYHCSYPSLSGADFSEGNYNDVLGFPSEETTYEKFKSSCLQLGESSPLAGYWGLFDHFSKYWMKSTNYAEHFPIDMSTVDEDCLPLPKRSNDLDILFKLIRYVKTEKKEGKLPFDVDLIETAIDTESILSQSRQLCEKYHLDFNVVMKPFVLEGLGRVVNELLERNSMTNEIAVVITTRLEARIQIHRMVQMYPEILDEKIESPVFILGLNRTGTTFLHKMLESSGVFLSVHPDDQVFLPKVEKIVNLDKRELDERISVIQSLLETVGFNALGVHEIEMETAEEDGVAHTNSFMSLAYDVNFDLPKYRAWLENQPFDEVYVEHKIWMQFISWWRRIKNPSIVGRRWCYKFPWHLHAVESLLKVYPDARLVHTHRDIADVAPSWCSLVKGTRSLFIESDDDVELGKGQMELLEYLLRSGVQFRQAHPELEDKWIDIQYTDLIKFPEGTAQKILTHAGLEANDETTVHLNNYVNESRKRLGQVKLHKPKKEDFGLTQTDFDREIFKKECTMGSNGGWFW